MPEEKDKKQEESVEDEEKQEKPELKRLDSIRIDSPEDLQKLLDRLSGSGVNGKKVKKIGLINRLFPNIFVNLLFYLVIYSLITVAVQGYLNLFNFDHFYKLIIFMVSFGLIETLGRDILYSKLPFVVITSFGLVLLLLTVLSAIGIAYIIPGFSIRSFGIFAVYILILLVFRTVITNYVESRFRPYLRKKKQNKK